MIEMLIGIIFLIIILGVVWWAVQSLLPLIPMAEPFKTIVHVLMVLILVFVVLWIILQILIASGITSGSIPMMRLK